MSTEPRRLGKYELRERLARGGQGEVWKAFDPQLRRYVAIKQLHANLQSDPGFVSRFEREARFIAALHHPNIVQIHDFQAVQTADVDTTLAYMVMEYIEGETLAEYIAKTSRRGLFPDAADIVFIFTGVSLALDYAHGKGMIHRDIKPANIMLDQRSPHGRAIGVPILTDFGIAKLQEVSVDTTRVLGTPRYVSPEQAQGLPGDKRSDLYSLGIILYEITTGITPFRGETTMAILMQHLQDMPTPPSLINPNISPALSAVILKSIAKRPEDRFPSASAMTIALAEALDVPAPQLQQSAPSSYLSPTAPATLPADNPLSPSHMYGRSNMSGPGPNASTYTPPGVTSTPAQAAAQPAIERPVTSAPQKQGGIRGRTVLLTALAALVLLGLGLGAFMLLSRPTSPPANVVAGQVRFTRSAHAVAGDYDELQIDLRNVPQPQAGHVYYAWLEIAGNEGARPHWKLTVAPDGTIHATNLTYPGYNNLLSPNMILLITEEDASGPAPIVPFPEPRARLYYAQIAPLSATIYNIKACPAGSASNVCMQ